MTTSTLQELKTIDTHHWNEWKNSAVNDTIVTLNVRTIYDSREIDKILNRNTKSRTKHSDHLIPAWCVSGVDPLTDEPILEGVQVKPDVPQPDKKGKVQKYLGANDVSAAPLFLNVGIENYWKSIIDDKTIPVIITEGAKKAGAGLSIGLPTVSIPGVSTCRKTGRLHYMITNLAGFGRTFYLCFDADILVKRPVQNSLIELARELAATGSKVMVIQLPNLELKGMDDYIAAKGEAEFKKIMDESLTIEEWKVWLDEQRKNQDDSFDEEERNSRIYRAYRIIKSGWGESIRLNTLKKRVELEDGILDLDFLKLYIAQEFDIDVSKEDAHCITMAIAKNNSYSPVVEYLDALANRYRDVDTAILDNLAFKYFGTADPLHQIYLKKTLIAAVARARMPGCKVDTSCILVGQQGIRKSTFWKELAGSDWFTDELSDSNEKDELLKLHKFWILELPEIEHIYRRKDVSSFKKFLSSSIDAFRTPYDREIKEHPRRCILVGTSNENQLLNDPTGNRRFWVIPVSQEIPTDELIRERDLIWAAADKLFQNGHQWWLTPGECELQKEDNENYQMLDPWEEIISSYVETRETVTTQEILSSALSLEPARQDKLAERRVSSIMKGFDWEQTRTRINGHVLRSWRRKFSKISGSSGSSGSFLVQQAFEGDPDISKIDQLRDLSGSVLQNTPSELIQKSESDPLDPDMDQYLDQPESLQGANDPDDPDDPDIFQTFSEKNAQQTEQPLKPAAIGKIEAGQIYWSLSLQSKVKVKQLFPSVRKADVYIPKEFEPIRVKCLDLYPLPGDDWSLNIGQLADYAGQVVAVVGYNRDKREYQLESKPGQFQYAKKDKLAKPSL